MIATRRWDLPASPFDACDRATGQVNPHSPVRCKTDDYPVPVAYGHRDVWLRGDVDQVVIGCGGDVIARYPRCRDRADMVFDPVHYLPLPEHKTGALERAIAGATGSSPMADAAPLAGWDLPEEFATLRRLMASADDRGGA